MTFFSLSTILCNLKVCKNWRYSLFHPNFWNKITFNFTDTESIKWFRLEFFIIIIYALVVIQIVKYIFYLGIYPAGLSSVYER